MINIHGPTWKYNGEVLTKPEIIFITDHHFDEEEKCFHVQKLLDNSTCDPKFHTLIFDHVNHEDDLKDYNCVHFPVFLAGEAQEFLEADIKPNWNNKVNAFNFMINKPRFHREFLLMLIDHFKLVNYNHSLAWKTTDNFVNPKIKQTTTNPFFLNIIDSHTKTSVQPTDYKFGPEVTMDRGIRNGNFQNAETYKHLLKTTVFEPSCISIISEPIFFEKEALVTEKTLMAIMGGNIPIWFGGWKCADSMRYLGFDVFDDIVDHSYESLEDPISRCYYAIERNLHLLEDVKTTITLLNKNKHRLQHNLDLVMENVFLKDCFKQMNNSSKELQHALYDILPEFRNKMFRNIMDQYKGPKYAHPHLGKSEDTVGLSHDKAGII
jgi:hypothetical protein